MKHVTESAHAQAVNKAVDFINARLARPIALQEVARHVHMSSFHFHRVFKQIMGQPLTAYVTRLRLEKAACYLHFNGASVGAVAQKTGYQSAFALSRAFKRHFAVAPTAFQKRPVHTLLQQPGTVLPNKVVQRHPMRLLYIRVVAPYGTSAVYDAAWQALVTFAQARGLITPQTEYIGLSFDDPAITQPDDCRFYACINVPANADVKAADKFGVLEVPANQYAVFTLKGPYSGLNALWQHIYLVWLPNSHYTLAKGMPFEKYLNSPDQVAPNELCTELYVPVQKK